MFFFFQAEDGIRDYKVTGVQTCALPILSAGIGLAGGIGGGRGGRERRQLAAVAEIQRYGGDDDDGQGGPAHEAGGGDDVRFVGHSLYSSLSTGKLGRGTRDGGREDHAMTRPPSPVPRPLF